MFIDRAFPYSTKLISQSSTASSEDAPITSTAWMNWKDVFLKCVQPMLAVVLLLRFSSIVDEAGFSKFPFNYLIIILFFSNNNYSCLLHISGQFGNRMVSMYSCFKEKLRSWICENSKSFKSHSV